MNNGFRAPTAEWFLSVSKLDRDRVSNSKPPEGQTHTSTESSKCIAGRANDQAARPLHQNLSTKLLLPWQAACHMCHHSHQVKRRVGSGYSFGFQNHTSEILPLINLKHLPVR